MTYVPPSHGFRTFVIVWAAQSLSVIGSGMTGFALNVYLAQVLYPAPEQKAELAFAFTILNLGFTIPFVFGGPLAGAWADRHDRKQIMIVTNTVNGLITLLTFILMLSGSVQLWMLVCIGVLAAAAGAFHYAAFDASYAMLVSDNLLPRVNGMMQTTWSLSGVISPALAALIIAVPALLPLESALTIEPIVATANGTSLIIAVDALTFFLCAAVLLLVHVPSPTRSDAGASGRVEQSLWADVCEGALFIWQRPPLLWLLAMFAVANLACAPTGVVVPLLVKFNLESDWAARGYTFETALALLGVASGVGGVIGGLLVSTWGGLKRNRVYGVLAPMLVAGIFQIVYGLSPLLLLSAAVASLGAAMHPILNAHSQSIWQSHTPRELQGRVFSIRRLIAWTIMPISTAGTGALAGVLDPGYVFASLGMIWALFCATHLFNPYLLRVDDKAVLDADNERLA